MDIKKDDPRVYLNRAQVNLKLNKYYNAYNDAEKSIQFSTRNKDKAYFRMGKAAYSMRQFEKSFENFKKCLEILNNDINKVNHFIIL